MNANPSFKNWSANDWAQRIDTLQSKRALTLATIARLVHASFDEIKAAREGKCPPPPGVDKRLADLLNTHNIQ